MASGTNQPWQLDKEECEHARFRLRKYLRAQYGDEEWGDLAVTMLLDTFEEQVAPLYYNHGISTVQRAMREFADTFEVNTDALKQYPKPDSPKT